MNRKIFENFILVAIFLVIVQTFLDDYARYADFEVKYRTVLLFTGFLFDLLFSIEFCIRSRWAIKEKKFGNYLGYQRGWIDFLASFPLLLLNSAPMVYLYLSGHLNHAGEAVAVLNVLKVVRAIRIIRILRLIRILKIFGKIHNTKSTMAQHHTQTIATIAIFTIIVVIMAFSVLKFNKLDVMIDNRKAYYSEMLENIENVNKTMDIPLKDLSIKILSSDKNILKLTYADFLLFSNIDENKIIKYYDFDDQLKIEQSEFDLYLSIMDINKIIAGIHLEFFFIIIALVFSFMVIYTKHFVQNITDVIHVILRGFKEKDYNLQVKIKEHFKDDEIFELANEYNENYLPQKLKNQQEEQSKKTSALSMDDLINFKKES